MYSSILEGCEVTDIATNEAGYDYYRYMRAGGAGVILRIDHATESEFRFHAFRAVDRTSAWDNRGTLDYYLPSEFKEIR